MITFTLPLPPEKLHPNARPVWQEKSRLVKKARGEACFVASAVAPHVPWEAALLHVTFYLKRRRDEDGLISWLKAYIDGIQDEEEGAGHGSSSPFANASK